MSSSTLCSDSQPVLPPALRAAGVLLSQLIAQGLTDVVVCPGSRSAPLAYAAYRAAARGLVRLHVRVDERTAGFLAAGLAKASGVPAAVVTTSGTAVANLHPAVLEASHSAVPLIVLSADRPHELHGTGANQTTAQSGIFAQAPRLFVDVPAPSGRVDEPKDMRAVAARAWAGATGAMGRPGPVHVNLCLREPLAPNAQELALLDLIFDDSPTPITIPVPGRPGWGDAERELARNVASVRKSVVIAGDGSPALAARVAEAQGWPIVAEPTSSIIASENVIPGAVNLLSRSHLVGVEEGAWAELVGEIEQVVVWGHPTLTRPVQALIASPSVRTVVVARAGEAWNDPSRCAEVVLYAVAPELYAPPSVDLANAPRDTGSTNWLIRWRAAGTRCAAALDALYGDGDLTGEFTPMRAVRTVVGSSEPGDVLVLGSSSAIRDADAAVTAWPTEVDIYAQRGLAGIDGTVSTALGIAISTGRRTRALMGDLTFLHDAGALLHAAADPVGALDLVVLNDRGGAIFSGLEHSQAGDPELFERVFGTPHRAHLELLCAAYGVDHQTVTTTQELAMLLREPSTGIRVFEVSFARSQRADAGVKVREILRQISSSEQG